MPGRFEIGNERHRVEPCARTPERNRGADISTLIASSASGPRAEVCFRAEADTPFSSSNLPRCTERSIGPNCVVGPKIEATIRAHHCSRRTLTMPVVAPQWRSSPVAIRAARRLTRQSRDTPQ